VAWTTPLDHNPLVRRLDTPPVKNSNPSGNPSSNLNSSFLLATRIPPRSLPLPQTLQQKQGLRYERKVVKALRARGFDVEHNPWFDYIGGVCCPDIVIYELCKNRAIVVEVKLTYTPEAIVKSKSIYCRVVSEVTGLRSYPLVICKHLTNSTATCVGDFYKVLESPNPIYQWLGKGPIL
jgi:Holliday junction resolvase